VLTGLIRGIKEFERMIGRISSDKILKRLIRSQN
jgi:hypothetical protein